MTTVEAFNYPVLFASAPLIGLVLATRPSARWSGRDRPRNPRRRKRGLSERGPSEFGSPSNAAERRYWAWSTLISTLMESLHAFQGGSNVLNRLRLGRMARKYRASGMRYHASRAPIWARIGPAAVLDGPAEPLCKPLCQPVALRDCCVLMLSEAAFLVMRSIGPS